MMYSEWLSYFDSICSPVFAHHWIHNQHNKCMGVCLQTAYYSHRPEAEHLLDTKQCCQFQMCLINILICQTNFLPMNIHWKSVNPHSNFWFLVSDVHALLLILPYVSQVAMDKLYTQSRYTLFCCSSLVFKYIWSNNTFDRQNLFWSNNCFLIKLKNNVDRKSIWFVLL